MIPTSLYKTGDCSFMLGGEWPELVRNPLLECKGKAAAFAKVIARCSS